MSEEQAQESTQTSTSAQPANVETPQNNEQSSESSQPTQQTNGYDRVDFNKLSPELRQEFEPRFNRVYGQMKAQDRKLSEAHDVLRQQSEVIAQLQQGVGRVVEHINTQDFAASEEAARVEADRAFQKGDSKAYLAAMEKVTEVKAQKIFDLRMRQQQQQNQQRQPAQPQRQQANSAVDMANRAIQQGILSSGDESAFQAWQDEKDNNGNPIRPWAKRETAGESFDGVLLRAAGVFADPRFKNMSIEQRLGEVDRIMNVSRETPQQNVMGANLTTKGKTNTVKVSADMEKVLLRTAPRGSKASKNHDPIAWYRDQVQKARNNGARR